MEPSPRPSRSSSSASRKSNLTLDLSSVPPYQPPAPPSNTLLLTNLENLDIFTPDNLATIRNLISASAFIHAFAPLKSFRRIVVSFFDVDSAVLVRKKWDDQDMLGDKVRIYFGQDTPIQPRDEHLALPDAGKLFFISPPPSPPHGWEMRLEDAPNKQVHADDLVTALASLRQHDAPLADSPVTPADGTQIPGMRSRSRSSTLIYQPDDKSPNMPAVVVEDMTDEPDEDMSPLEPKAIKAHTPRPPVELMNDA